MVPGQAYLFKVRGSGIQRKQQGVRGPGLEGWDVGLGFCFQSFKVGGWDVGLGFRLRVSRLNKGSLCRLLPPDLQFRVWISGLKVSECRVG